MLCCLCCLFFFFKQKTAYEMRISDWSSDVCSSDLDVEHNQPRMGSKRHTQVYRHKLAIDHPHTLERPDDQGIIAVTADDRCKFILGPFYRERHRAQRRMHKSERRLIGHHSIGGLEHRSEEHTSELQSLMRISYAVF